MNVKKCLVFLVLIISLAAQADSAEPAESEAPEGAFVAQVYHNPYLNILHGLRSYCGLMFDRILTCVKHRLLTDAKATGQDIKFNCAGDRFAVVDKTFRQVIDKSFPVFMKIFSQRLFPLRFELADEIGYFVSRFRFFIRRNFVMFSSLKSVLKRSNYHVNKQKLIGLMEMLEAEIVLFAKFQERIKWDKKELVDDIQKLIDQRDEDLEALRRDRIRRGIGADEDSDAQSEDESEEDVPLYMEKEESLLDEQLEWLQHDSDHADQDDAMEEAAGRSKNKSSKEKSVEYSEKDLDEEEGGSKEPKKKDGQGHADHHDGHYSGYGKRPEETGYYMDDGEEHPYTKMPRLRESPDLVINDNIPGQ
jgi:hypothetical protein